MGTPLREAATRLDISRADVEQLVASGAVKSVAAGWTTMVLTSEMERLTSTAR
jgi:hypothetical protein